MTGTQDAEDWRAVPGYEGLYEVSAHGEVRSLDRVTVSSDGRRRAFTGQNISRRVDSIGYLKVTLAKAGASETRRVHVIVAEAFLGPRPPGHQVAHADGDRTNPHVSNLRYVTQSENEADKVLHGRSNRGERCGAAKLTTGDVHQIRSLGARGVAQAELARRYGVAPTTVWSILNRRIWSHLPDMTVDGCPTAGCMNTEAETSRIDLPHVVRASYVCADCGAAWLTDYPRKDT